MTYSQKECQRLRRLAEAATPGPYCPSTDNSVCAQHPRVKRAVMDLREFDEAEANATFLSAAHSMMTQINALEAIVKAQREALQEIADCQRKGGAGGCGRCMEIATEALELTQEADK